MGTKGSKNKATKLGGFEKGETIMINIDNVCMLTIYNIQYIVYNYNYNYNYKKESVLAKHRNYNDITITLLHYHTLFLQNTKQNNQRWGIFQNA